METFDFAPAPGAIEQTKPRVRAATFGDGYEQRVVDGINAQPRAWQLRFIRDASDVDEIVDFLEARAGAERFQWTPPRGAVGYWICSAWSVNMVDTAVQEVTATFQEQFGAL